ncbi:hypothetical protein NDU88_000293 [Pleurodeles waltl]|uniref:Uncharacterized protein n=1 Tax=Pleurodeles waltl TaxID=8319 RepID=A0AAV7P4K3_PLEWA|nr:hypothetical protein NDU88_000293 [Pleurodeles waltl]
MRRSGSRSCVAVVKCVSKAHVQKSRSEGVAGRVLLQGACATAVTQESRTGPLRMRSDTRQPRSLRGREQTRRPRPRPVSGSSPRPGAVEGRGSCEGRPARARSLAVPVVEGQL